MADIIIDDEDNFGKTDGGTSDNHATLNRNPDLYWNKTTRSLDIVRQQQLLSKKHLEPKVDVIIDQINTLTPESREASKALLKKWELDGYRPRPFPSLIPKHLKQKKDVVIVDYIERSASKSMVVKLSEKPPSANVLNNLKSALDL